MSELRSVESTYAGNTHMSAHARAPPPPPHTQNSHTPPNSGAIFQESQMKLCVLNHLTLTLETIQTSDNQYTCYSNVESLIVLIFLNNSIISDQARKSSFSHLSNHFYNWHISCKIMKYISNIQNCADFLKNEIEGKSEIESSQTQFLYK